MWFCSLILSKHDRVWNSAYVMNKQKISTPESQATPEYMIHMNTLCLGEQKSEWTHYALHLFPRNCLLCMIIRENDDLAIDMMIAVNHLYTSVMNDVGIGRCMITGKLNNISVCEKFSSNFKSWEFFLPLQRFSTDSVYLTN
jgi:hypothetical protein